MSKVLDSPVQQSDFSGSPAHILGVNYCRSAFNGIFLDPKPAPARYVVQARGDNRNRVDVYFDDRIASYFERADDSIWSGVQTLRRQPRWPPESTPSESGI